jgi:hypothetical protein
MPIGVAGRHGKFFDAFLKIGNDDVSADVRSLTPSWSKTDLAVGAMGMTAEAHDHGIETGSLDVELYQGFYTGGVASIFYAHYKNQTTFVVTYRPSKTAVESTTNRTRTFTGRILQDPYQMGTHGEEAMLRVSIVNATGVAVTETPTV